MAEIVRHVDYLVARIGVDHVAFGSDFEGAVVPDELGGVAGLPRLVDALRARGHDEESVAKITHRNWLRVLDETWRPWGRYFSLAGDDPRPTLLAAADRFAAPGLAVDLGAGTGRDTAELLRRGWSVIAIDREQEAIDRLRELVGPDSGRLETRVARFEDAEWPACDLVNASFSLPFCPPESFAGLWRRIVDSLPARRPLLRAALRRARRVGGLRDRRADAGRARRAARPVRGRAARRVRRRGDDRDREAQALARLPRRRAQALASGRAHADRRLLRSRRLRRRRRLQQLRLADRRAGDRAPSSTRPSTPGSRSSTRPRATATATARCSSAARWPAVATAS